MGHDHINPDRFADSAGVPWQGRHFEPNPHSSDDGSADPLLLSEIARFHAAEVGIERVVSQLAKSRVLIPLVADLGESAAGAYQQKVDKSADLSIVSVSTPDNQVAIPVFSSVSAMSAWNPKARPVPVDMPRVCLAAVQEKANRVILDPSSPTEFALRRPAIWAIAQQLEWSAPHANDDVKTAFAEGVNGEAAILNWAIYGEDVRSRLVAPEVTVLLKIQDGLSTQEIDDLIKRVSQKWAASSVIADKVDSMQLKLVRAS